MVAERDGKGWVIAEWCMSPSVQKGVKIEDLKATVSSDDGQFVLALGTRGEDGEIRIDAQATQLRVAGNRKIPLSGQERPTIVIGGNRAKGEPLRVLRIEAGAEPSPPGKSADGGRKGM
jgi:hypothetical protein